MNFYISEQKHVWDIARKHHWSENCSSPYWKDYTFWLQTYSQQVFVEWISQSISTAVYSCIMLKEGQDYGTSGQLLLSRLLNNNHVTLARRGLCHLTCHTCLRVPSGQEITEKHDYAAYSAEEYVISAGSPGLGCSVCDFLTKSIRDSPSFLVFLGRNMIAEDSLES